MTNKGLRKKVRLGEKVRYGYRFFFEKMAKELELGEIRKKPERISGGLMHRMFQVCTDKGRYVVKLLNPNIMKRPDAMGNFNRADALEEMLKENSIPAVYALQFKSKKMQELDGQYFYVYEWFDGKVLKDREIKPFHCEEIGSILAKIHNMDLKREGALEEEKHIDFSYYIRLAEERNSPIYAMLYDKLDLLNDSMQKGNIAVHKLPKVQAVCHNDLDSKNVMWLGEEFRIIDLESLGYSNPYLELYELALCWSGYERCNIDFDLFRTFFKSYFNHSDLDGNIDWESIYYANNGRLEWLEYNIKRALMIECDTKEEQELGIREVKGTVEHVVYNSRIQPLARLSC